MTTETYLRGIVKIVCPYFLKFLAELFVEICVGHKDGSLSYVTHFNLGLGNGMSSRPWFSCVHRHFCFSLSSLSNLATGSKPCRALR